MKEIRKKETPAQDSRKRFTQLFDLLSNRLLDAAAKAGHPSCIPGLWCFKNCRVCHWWLTEEDLKLFSETADLFRKIATPEERRRYL